MADWQLTPGLQNLRSQVNAAFPARDKESDGTIGDAAHMAESSSGHNPDGTAGSHPEYDDHDGIAEVRAWDMDSDLRSPGVTAQQVVDHIRGLPGVSSVIRYIIYNRKIYQSSNGWAPAAYAGPSPHTEHIHFSGARSQAADNNTTFDYRLEDLVALSPDDKKWIASLLNGAAGDVVPRWSNDGGPVAKDDPNPTMTLASALYYLGAAVKRNENLAADILTAVGQVDDQVLAGLRGAGQSVDTLATIITGALGTEKAAELGRALTRV